MVENLKLEEYLISCLLVDPNGLEKLRSIAILPNLSDLFFHQRTKAIFNRIVLIEESKLPIDSLVVLDGIINNPLFPDAVDYLIYLNKIVTTANIEIVIRLLIDKYQRRQCIEICQKSIDNAKDNDSPILLTISETVDNLTCVQQFNKSKLTHLSDCLIEVAKEIENGQETKIKTDFSDFDAITGGLSPTDFIILAARPGIGKTAFASEVVLNISKEYRQPVVFFSLEMSADQIIKRMIVSMSKIDSAFLGSKQIDESEQLRLEKTLLTLAELDIYINDNPLVNISQIAQECKSIKSMKGSLGLVVVDYIQLIATSEDSMNQQIELSGISRGLKILAKELKTPVIALSQLNRGVEARNNKRPLISDLRGSGGLEQDSDMILMLYRDEYYNPDTYDKGICELIVAKHRHGATGTVKLGFDGKYVKFYNLLK